MQEKIATNINNAENLEKLYRENKQEFKKSFLFIADKYDSELVNFWRLRLAPKTSKVTFSIMDLRIIFILTVISWLILKIPDFFPTITKDDFYARNIALVLFNGLILFTFWYNKFFDKNKFIIYSIVVAILAVFVNLLPKTNTDSINLALAHSPLFLWCVFGLAFISLNNKNISKRIEYIRFNGEFIIMTGLIMIAGGLFTAITMQLFKAIDIDIREFYTKNILILGISAIPMVSFYLIKIYPDITRKITPVIAKIFTPIVVVTLFIYLVTFAFSAGKIIEDREILIIFNVMLVAVLALIVFSISELDKSVSKNYAVLMLFLLALIAIIIDIFALTAIISRLALGFTPNRTVVFGSNLLIFVNLIFIAKSLFLAYFKNESVDLVEEIVAKYLTIYMFWTLFVIFILPLIFQFH